MLDRIERLSAYVDGDLGPAETEAIEQEIAASAELQHEVEALRGLKSIAREAPLPAAPDRWVQIEGRLRAGRRRRWAIVAAAAAVLLAFLAWPKPEPVRAPSLAENLQSARAAYVGAIERLAAESSRASEKLPPEARAQLQASLRIVDHQIELTKEVLARAPDDPFGHETLLTLYEEKVRILTAAIEASSLGGAS